MTEETEDDRPLLERVEGVGRSVEALRGDIAGESVKRDKRIRTNKRSTWAAFVVGVLGIVVAVVATTIAVKAGDSADVSAAAAVHAQQSADTAAAALATFQQQTQVARVATCNNSNTSELKQAAAERAESHDFVAALVEGSTDPSIEARAARFNAKHDKLITDAHSLRDCSPAGIQRYLHQQGSAVSVGEVPGTG